MDTFVIRIWTPASAAGELEVTRERHGVAQHVATGRSGIFRSDAQLLMLLGELPKPSADDRGIGDERIESMPSMSRKEHHS